MVAKCCVFVPPDQSAMLCRLSAYPRQNGLALALRDRRFENQTYRAFGLNLLVAALILWNICYPEMARPTRSRAKSRHWAGSISR